MKRVSFMVIAGEASGDQLAAELVLALRAHLGLEGSMERGNAQPLRASLAPEFFGAGGPRMAKVGVHLHTDLTLNSAIGPTEAAKGYLPLRRTFWELLALAVERQPDVVILVDYSYFNHRFAKALRAAVKATAGAFSNWSPKIVKYVSPQVWASRPGRAKSMARDLDLLLCIFPFEKAWYADRVPNLTVDYVGHPILDRHREAQLIGSDQLAHPLVVLLPGSRRAELQRHLNPMFDAVRRLRAGHSTTFTMVLPSQALAEEHRPRIEALGIELQVGGLAEVLPRATAAIASTGSVTMECAWFGVPTVTIYKTSWVTYQIGKRVLQIPYLAMPNILAGERIFPELIQSAATGSSIAEEVARLLKDPAQRESIHAKLGAVIKGLGTAGASARGAAAITALLYRSTQWI